MNIDSRSLKLCAALAATFLLPSLSFAQYVRTDLVTDTGTALNPPDTDLVNAWGLVSSSTSPYWLSDNVTGKSTLYAISPSTTNPSGVTATKLGLVVSVPTANGGPGSPTGIVNNGDKTIFIVTFTDPVTHVKKSGPAKFLFATLDGTISGWNPNVGPGGDTATIAIDRSGIGASYTGLAIGTTKEGSTFLYAADGGPNRRIDMIDGQFNVTSFTDSAIPKDFTAYGIQVIGEDLWVTWTSQGKAQGGFVDKFDLAGNLKMHFAVHGPLHSPWGIALAPGDFGPMSGALLISNNTSRGRINAFDPNTGAFLGPLRDANNNPIEIDEVWALQFGQDGGSNGAHNQLFFTGGPNGYADGVFGVITVAP